MRKRTIMEMAQGTSMTKDEAMMRLTLAYGHNPAVADFNIVAVNHVLDSLIQAEREACAKVVESHGTWFTTETVAAAIRNRGQTTSNIQSYLEKDNSQPEQEQNEFELRGMLATLLCWHRLTQAEQEDLLRFTASPYGLINTQGFEPDWANFQEGRKVGRAEALERAWVDLTRQQFLDVTDDLEDLEDCWIQIQAKLKEVNIR